MVDGARIFLAGDVSVRGRHDVGGLSLTDLCASRDQVFLGIIAMLAQVKELVDGLSHTGGQVLVGRECAEVLHQVFLLAGIASGVAPGTRGAWGAGWRLRAVCRSAYWSTASSPRTRRVTENPAMPRIRLTGSPPLWA